MKKYLVLSVLCALIMPAFAAERSSISNSKAQSASPRVGVSATTSRMPTMSKGTGFANTGAAVKVKDETGVSVVDDDAQPINRDKERIACLSNNIGVGDTFVWASKDSNTSNYASMVEDKDHPENNVCFVLVGMRSEDSRISTADIQPRYFEWGNNITCGSWIDEAKMEERILAAKKTARTLGTIGGAVGGAGIGVGAMELFGNNLLAKAGVESVQGQKAYTQYTKEWYNVKVNELKVDKPEIYTQFEESAKELVEECEKSSHEKCGEQKYKGIIEWYKEAHSEQQ